MHLILPRPYPECLERHSMPFGVINALFTVSLYQRQDSLELVRSLDCKRPNTIPSLLETAMIHRLKPINYNFNKVWTVQAFLEKLVNLYPGYTRNGYLATSFYKNEITGWEYSVSFHYGKLTIGKRKILPEIIPLGFDVILANTRP